LSLRSNEPNVRPRPPAGTIFPVGKRIGELPKFKVSIYKGTISFGREGSID